MNNEFINLTEKNLANEHLCCIIRAKEHSGIEAKRKWISGRLSEGHVFRKLDIKGCAFIEYAPLENAWVPIVGDNFYYIYCLWVQGAPRGCGYGHQFMEHCIDDAKKLGKSGICMLGAKKQKNWLSDQKFAEKFGFETADETEDGYRLLALSFDGSKPKFATSVTQKIDRKELTVYYDFQCPYIFQRIEKLEKYCADKNIPANFILVDTLEKAKSLPCVFNNWAVFYGGKFITVNQIDGPTAEKIIKPV